MPSLCLIDLRLTSHPPSACESPQWSAGQNCDQMECLYCGTRTRSQRVQRPCHSSRRHRPPGHVEKGSLGITRVPYHDSSSDHLSRWCGPAPVRSQEPYSGCSSRSRFGSRSDSALSPLITHFSGSTACLSPTENTCAAWVSRVPCPWCLM